MKTLESLLKLYTIKVIPLDEKYGGGFEAHYQELGTNISGYGATQAEAVEQLEEVTLDVMADEPLSEFPQPQTEKPWGEYSGRVTLRMTKILHAQLDQIAREQEVSLNHLMTLLLQEGVSAVSKAGSGIKKPKERAKAQACKPRAAGQLSSERAKGKSA